MLQKHALTNIDPNEYLMKTNITMAGSHWCHALLISTSSQDHHEFIVLVLYD